MGLCSGERNFGVALNRPFTQKLPLPDLPPVTGSHTDLLIVVIHRLVVNGSEKLKPLHNCFLTILSNVSPYSKSLSLLASQKLVRASFLVSCLLTSLPCYLVT